MLTRPRRRLFLLCWCRALLSPVLHTLYKRLDTAVEGFCPECGRETMSKNRRCSQHSALVKTCRASQKEVAHCNIPASSPHPSWPSATKVAYQHNYVHNVAERESPRTPASQTWSTGFKFDALRLAPHAAVLREAVAAAEARAPDRASILPVEAIVTSRLSCLVAIVCAAAAGTPGPLGTICTVP